jgi:hypothetical protein
MYLANYEGQVGHYLEGGVRLTALPPPTETAWWNALGSLARFHESVEGGAYAFRVILRRKGRLEGAFFALAPETQEVALRRWLAGFTRLDAIAGNSIALPTTRAGHDSLAADFPPFRASLTFPPFQQSQAWFACDFRAGPLLNDLLLEAARMGYEMGWQVHVQPMVPRPEWLRQGRKNLLRVREFPGAPQALIRVQEDLLRRLQESAAVSEEYLGVESDADGIWLRGTLKRYFEKLYRGAGLELPDFNFSDSGLADVLEPPFHSLFDSEAPVGQICGWALDDSTLTDLVCWKPSGDLWRELSTSTEIPAQKDEPVISTRGPEPWAGDSGYFFVSYKRQDLPRLVHILQEMKSRNWRFWYDQGLLVGEEWHAQLEKKLEDCAQLVLFATQAAIDSRYVRREVLFADTLNKPIIIVTWDVLDLRHGMKMLANQYQTLESTASDFWTALALATGQS